MTPTFLPSPLKKKTPDRRLLDHPLGCLAHTVLLIVRLHNIIYDQLDHRIYDISWAEFS